MRQWSGASKAWSSPGQTIPPACIRSAPPQASDHVGQPVRILQAEAQPRQGLSWGPRIRTTAESARSVIKAAPLRGAAGAPATGLCVGDARPVRARRRNQTAPVDRSRSLALPASAGRSRLPRHPNCPTRAHRLKPALRAPLRAGFASLDPVATPKDPAPARKAEQTCGWCGGCLGMIGVVSCGQPRSRLDADGHRVPPPGLRYRRP